MPAPLPVRTDRDPADLRRLARRERDGRAGARLPALADASDGPPRGEAARLAGTAGRTLGDRAHRHDTGGVGGPARTGPRPGRPRAPTKGGGPPRRPWCRAAPTWRATAAPPGAPATLAITHISGQRRGG